MIGDRIKLTGSLFFSSTFQSSGDTQIMTSRIWTVEFNFCQNYSSKLPISLSQSLIISKGHRCQSIISLNWQLAPLSTWGRVTGRTLPFKDHSSIVLWFLRSPPVYYRVYFFGYQFCTLIAFLGITSFNYYYYTDPARNQQQYNDVVGDPQFQGGWLVVKNYSCSCNFTSFSLSFTADLSHLHSPTPITVLFCNWGLSRQQRAIFTYGSDMRCPHWSALRSGVCLYRRRWIIGEWVRAVARLEWIGIEEKKLARTFSAYFLLPFHSSPFIHSFIYPFANQKASPTFHVPQTLRQRPWIRLVMGWSL